MSVSSEVLTFSKRVASGVSTGLLIDSVMILLASPLDWHLPFVASVFYLGALGAKGAELQLNKRISARHITNDK